MALVLLSKYAEEDEMGFGKLFQKITWAIDPLCADNSIQLKAATALETLSRSLNFLVKPVAVILEEQIPYLVGDSKSKADFASQIEQNLSQWISKTKIPNLEKPSLLIEKNFSVKSGALQLIHWAQENICDVIVATTHAKHRQKPGNLGTFAESLFLQSPLPLFMVPIETELPSKYDHVFFPTDLSPNSLRTLDLILELTHELQAQLTLFHKFFGFLPGVVEFPNSTAAKTAYIEKVHFLQRIELEQTCKKLREQGLIVNLVTDQIETDYVSTSITVRTHDLRSGFIAMASHTQDELHCLPGSVTRQVLSNARIPVLVLHPERQKY
jgi:nucleotide-binding universal stress UspA family protein